MIKSIGKYVMFLFLTGFLNAQEVLDKVVAVVDNEIILKSELENEAAYYAIQRNLNPKDPEVLKQILNLKIEEKLLYAQAALDSVNVSDDDVNRQIESQLNYFIKQYGSVEKIEELYGMSIDRIKREFREETRKNLMAQTMRQKKFGLIEITRPEVENFFNKYKDSLGVISEKLKIAHIFINPKAGDRVKLESLELAKSLLDSLKGGAPFEEFAKKYSGDPGSAENGGDLGFVKRGIFYPEFEAAAFALSEGELSNVVESPVGFHIIQLIERRGESIHARHILIKIKSDDAADLRTIELLSEIKDSLTRGLNSFEYFAEKYSSDKESAKNGGLLGEFEVSQLDKTLLNTVYKLKEGEISAPKRLDIDRNSYGFHIVKLLQKIPEHLPTIDGDYNEIKKLAEYEKRERLYKKWITELKEKIFWEIRL